MDRNVTVVPVDNLIIVDSEPLVFSFQADEDIHAVQWSGGLCKGHIEVHSQPLPVYFDTKEAYEEHVAPFVALWENHKAWLQAEQEPEQPTADQLADTARSERDSLIESVRWRIERHSDELALGREPTEPLEPLLQYVQDLRDVPQQEGFPETISWPVLSE